MESNFADYLIRNVRVFNGDFIFRISLFQKYWKNQVYISKYFVKGTLPKKANSSSIKSYKQVITIRLCSFGKYKDQILQIALSWIFNQNFIVANYDHSIDLIVNIHSYGAMPRDVWQMISSFQFTSDSNMEKAEESL